MSTITIYRANAKMRRNAAYQERANVVFSNAIDPKDKATLEELKRKLKQLAEEGTDAEFQAAQKQYDAFVDKLKSNAKENASALKFKEGDKVSYDGRILTVERAYQKGAQNFYDLKDEKGSYKGFAEHILKKA